LQREFILRLPQELAGKPHLILEYRLGVPRRDSDEHEAAQRQWNNWVGHRCET